MAKVGWDADVRSLKAPRDADRQAASTSNAEARCAELESQRDKARAMLVDLAHAFAQSEDERWNAESRRMMELDRADDAEDRADRAESDRYMAQDEAADQLRYAEEEAETEVSEVRALLASAHEKIRMILGFIITPETVH